MKVMRIIAMISLIALLQGCGFIRRNLGKLTKFDLEVLKMESYDADMTDKVIKRFNEKDAEGLKALFCEKSRNMKDIDEQIRRGFAIFGGKAVSLDDHFQGYEGESKEEGRTVSLLRSWGVKDVQMDSGGKIDLYIKTRPVSLADKGKEGILQILMGGGEGEELEIGYAWPDHYKEGSALAYQAIKALSDRNMDGLRSLFCAKSRNSEGLDGQLRAGIGFFEGKATFGRKDEDGKEYDGRHDYNTTVRDEEAVENNLPVRTLIRVRCVNIETTAKKIYEMEFEAYLKNAEDASLEGITGMKISGDGGSRIISAETRIAEAKNGRS